MALQNKKQYIIDIINPILVELKRVYLKKLADTLTYVHDTINDLYAYVDSKTANFPVDITNALAQAKAYTDQKFEDTILLLNEKIRYIDQYIRTTTQSHIQDQNNPHNTQAANLFTVADRPPMAGEGKSGDIWYQVLPMATSTTTIATTPVEYQSPIDVEQL